jgi:hypothetical protein
MTKQISLKAENYGEVIAAIKNLELVSFEEDGGYQGKYLAILKDEDRLFYYIGEYGSCSGCDWLADVLIDGEVPYKEALDYVTEELQPKYIVPIKQPLTFRNNGEYEGFELVI